MMIKVMQHHTLIMKTLNNILTFTTMALSMILPKFTTQIKNKVNSISIWQLPKRFMTLMARKCTKPLSVIMAMVVPYCMIHFGKPWAEADGDVAERDPRVGRPGAGGAGHGEPAGGQGRDQREAQRLRFDGRRR